MVFITNVFHQETEKKKKITLMQPIGKERANYTNNLLATTTLLQKQLSEMGKNIQILDFFYLIIFKYKANKCTNT